MDALILSLSQLFVCCYGGSSSSQSQKPLSCFSLCCHFPSSSSKQQSQSGTSRAQRRYIVETSRVFGRALCKNTHTHLQAFSLVELHATNARKWDELQVFFGFSVTLRLSSHRGESNMYQIVVTISCCPRPPFSLPEKPPLFCGSPTTSTGSPV